MFKFGFEDPKENVLVYTLIIHQHGPKCSKSKTKKRERPASDEGTTMTSTAMVQEARILLIKLNQQQHFKEEFKLLQCAKGNRNFA